MKFWQAFLWQRSLREKRALFLAALIVAAAGLYGGVWLPLQSARMDRAAKLPVIENALADLRAQARDAAGLVAVPRTQARFAASGLAARARAEGLSLTLSKADPPGEKRLSFFLSESPIEPALGLLETLRREAGWQVSQLRLTKVNERQVNADVVLERP